MAFRPLHCVYNLLNAALRIVGLKLQRIAAPTRSFRDFFEHIGRLGFVVETVIDVGIAKGTPGIYRAYPNAKYFLVEPVEEFAPALATIAKRLRAEVFLVAAGASDAEVTFNVHDDLSGSSLFSQAEGRELDGKPRLVKRRRLDGLLPPSLKHPILLKIDTQGAEIDVLKGMGERLREIDLIVVEASLFAFRKDAAEIGALVRFMEERDFVIYDVLEGHMRALDGALAQIDLAFVPRNSPLRQDERFFDASQLRRYRAKWRRD